MPMDLPSDAPARPAPASGACTLEHVLCSYPGILERLLRRLAYKRGQGALRECSSALRDAIDRSLEELPVTAFIPRPQHAATLRALLKGFKRGCRPALLNLSFLASTETDSEHAWRQDAL
jgi:hypothetical protein